MTTLLLTIAMDTLLIGTVVLTTAQLVREQLRGRVQLRSIRPVRASAPRRGSVGKRRGTVRFV
jgi:hypothetical protein